MIPGTVPVPSTEACDQDGSGRTPRMTAPDSCEATRAQCEGGACEAPSGAS